MNILDELVAKGVSSEVIIAVAKLIAEAEQLQERRSKNAERMRVVRTRAHTSMHTETQKPSLSFLEEEKKEVLTKKERKGVRGKPFAIPLPDDWQPKGPQRDPTEADEFRDMCRSKGRMYLDFDAAYRNFQRSQYNARNKSGAVIATVRPTMTAAEGRALVEAKRLQILREAEDAEKGNDARLRGNSDMGDGRERNAPQLRLAGGISHEDAERRRAESDALFTATASALRR